jgi:hypothetical protein
MVVGSPRSERSVVISLLIVPDPAAAKWQPFRLTKFGARVAVTGMFAYLGAELASYYAPESAKDSVFVLSVPVWAFAYWRLWSWVMSLRPRLVRKK